MEAVSPSGKRGASWIPLKFNWEAWGTVIVVVACVGSAPENTVLPHVVS